MRSFNDFLQQAGSGSDDFPKSLDKLAAAGIRLVVADMNDPDGRHTLKFCVWKRIIVRPVGSSQKKGVIRGSKGVGYVQWRVAWYVAGEDGSVANFLSLWDDYLVFKTKAMAKDIELHIFPHTGIDELEQSKMEAELNYEHYHFHAPAEESELPLKWHEACPVIGKRVATCHLTASSETELKFIWSGNTWAFRDAMDEHGVKGFVICCICVLFVLHCVCVHARAQ